MILILISTMIENSFFLCWLYLQNVHGIQLLHTVTETIHYFSSEAPLCNLPVSILSSYQDQTDPVKMQDSLNCTFVKTISCLLGFTMAVHPLSLSPPSYSSSSQWLPSSQWFSSSLWLSLFIMSSNAWITCLLLCLSHHLSFCSPYFLQFILVNLASHWPSRLVSLLKPLLFSLSGIVFPCLLQNFIKCTFFMKPTFFLYVIITF